MNIIDRFRISFHCLLNLCLLLVSVELEACVIFVVVFHSDLKISYVC